MCACVGVHVHVSGVFVCGSLPGLFPTVSCLLINGFLHEALPNACVCVCVNVWGAHEWASKYHGLWNEM